MFPIASVTSACNVIFCGAEPLLVKTASMLYGLDETCESGLKV